MTRTSQVVGVHLDLKYQMPGKRYLHEWVRRLPAFGINTLVIEYEDKFPYERFPFLRHEDAFKPEELRDWLAAARAAGLRLVPLVQSLSHLEFALGHEELASLRECPDIPTQICPCNTSAVEFVHDLEDEILSFHEQDEWFHIGGDEAWSLGSCPQCARRAGGDTTSLWLEHTSGVCARLDRLGKRALMWDDAFWETPSLSAELPANVILCSWDYGMTCADPAKNPARLFSEYIQLKREAVGCPCLNWGSLLPRHHTMENTSAWASLLRARRCGMINTSWASFHTPLPAWIMQVAATGACMRGTELTASWEADFLSGEFGAHIPGLPEALVALGETWEIPVDGLGRPITLPLHACMDMVMHYPGGQQERKKRGAYPLNMEEVDFTALHRRKLELLRTLSDCKPVCQKLDGLLNDYQESAAKLRALAEAAQRHREEAALLLALGELKLIAMRGIGHSLQRDSPPASLRRELRACMLQLDELLPRVMEPGGVRLFNRMYSLPLKHYLECA